MLDVPNLNFKLSVPFYAENTREVDVFKLKDYSFDSRRAYANEATILSKLRIIAVAEILISSSKFKPEMYSAGYFRRLHPGNCYSADKI